mgnify:CR=1 FL=1
MCIIFENSVQLKATSEAVLDFTLQRNFYEWHESYLLLLGLCLDMMVPVSEKELEGFIRRFKKMQDKVNNEHLG